MASKEGEGESHLFGLPENIPWLSVQNHAKDMDGFGGGSYENEFFIE